MRRYGRYCLAIMFMAFVAWLSLPVLLTHVRVWLKYSQRADLQTLSATASNSLVYPIKAKQWLKFAIPEDSLQLRIITNAHIERDEAVKLTTLPKLAPNWDYALHYELLDNQGLLLSTGSYQLHSNLTTYKDAQGVLVYSNYYADKNKVPLDGRFIVLGSKAIKDTAFIRISIEAKNPAIIESAVRVYVPAKISEHQIATSWLRMNQQQKDNLAKNNIYPAFLLSEAERINLLKHQWQPIGPMGIEGKNYQSLTLYTLDEKEIKPYDPNALMLASGLQADAQHDGVIPIPEQGGQLALSFKALDGSALVAPVSIDLQWFGRSLDQRWRHSAIWTKDSNDLNYQLDGGLLVVRPSSPVIVTTYLTTATEAKHELLYEPLTIKTYLPIFGVDFNVQHFQQQSTGLRIDVRKLLTTAPQPECINAGQQQIISRELSALKLPWLVDCAGNLAPLGHYLTAPEQIIRYQGLNAQQQIITSGELAPANIASLYDRVGIISELINISDPLSYYFHLPASVSRLRLESNNPALLINAYNQPYDFTSKQRIPEDAYVANKDTQDQQLTWFPLRAANDESLMQQQAVQWVSSQYRPPEDDPYVLAGQYLWQDYIPEDGVAKYLLTEYLGDEPRSDALATVYCSLSVNHDTQVTLNALNGLRSVVPELIVLREHDTPFSSELFLNGQKVTAAKTMGRQAIMPLPEIPLGRQQLRLNTDSGGRWLMNYQQSCSGQRYLKRRVFALNTRASLDFVVQHKSEDELWSARLYSPINSVDRSQINVNIEAKTTTVPSARVSTSWTNQKHLYDIRPLPTKALPILYTQGQALSNGELFVIPINSDLPEGEYHIHIALAKGVAGYLTLSQIMPGVHEQRRFYRESEHGQ